MGSVRTYVYTGQTAPDLDGWLAGLRRGASFVTNGPLVDLRVETARPGGEVALDGPGTVSVSVEVSSIVPLARVWLVADGEAVREIPLAPDRRGATFRGDVPVTRSGWIHLRAEGEESERFPLDSPYAQAFTNPVWVTVGGRPPRDAASARYGMAWMDRLRELASAWPGWRSRREIDHVMGQVAEARAVYEALLGEALERDRDR